MWHFVWPPPWSIAPSRNSRTTFVFLILIFFCRIATGSCSCDVAECLPFHKIRNFFVNSQLYFRSPILTIYVIYHRFCVHNHRFPRNRTWCHHHYHHHRHHKKHSNTFNILKSVASTIFYHLALILILLLLIAFVLIWLKTNISANICWITIKRCFDKSKQNKNVNINWN